MNTKVEEALGVLAYEAQAHRDDGNTTPADALDKARTTLAAHIAQQDATIARVRAAAMRLDGVSRQSILAALNQGEGK